MMNKCNMYVCTGLQLPARPRYQHLHSALFAKHSNDTSACWKLCPHSCALGTAGSEYKHSLQHAVLSSACHVPNIWGAVHGALQVCKSLRFSGISVPRDYEQSFQRALWTFQHQRVWCPQRKQLVHLHPLPVSGLAAGKEQNHFEAQNVMHIMLTRKPAGDVHLHVLPVTGLAAGRNIDCAQL